MKTKKRIKWIEAELKDLDDRISRISAVLHTYETWRLQKVAEKNYEQPITTGIPLPPNPTIVSGSPFKDNPTVTNMNDVPFTYTGEQK